MDATPALSPEATVVVQRAQAPCGHFARVDTAQSLNNVGFSSVRLTWLRYRCPSVLKEDCFYNLLHTNLPMSKSLVENDVIFAYSLCALHFVMSRLLVILNAL